MTAPPDLAAFLAALRAEGVPVGPGELARLGHVFRLEPELDRARLRTVLASTLVKDDRQRERFDGLFEEWLERAGRAVGRVEEEAGEEGGERGEGRPRSETPSGPRFEPPPREPERRGRPVPWLGIGVALATVAIAVASAAWWWTRPPARPPVPEQVRRWVERGEAPAPAETARSPLPFAPASTFHTWVAELGDPVPGPRVPAAAWPPLGLALAALAASGVLGLAYRRRFRLPPPAGEPAPGPDWLPLGAPEAVARLLDGDSLRAAVWGVERFVSDEPTRRVDVERTVAATARNAGIPTVVRAAAVHPRELWLWRDVETEDPTAERITTELATALARAALPVRVGRFADVPDRVAWESGEETAPGLLEGHRQSARVAVLTDGRGLAAALADASERRATEALLHRLGDWPHLAFVDLGVGLSRELAGYRIDCLRPEALPAFLAGAEPPDVPPPPLAARITADVTAWAAACALAPEPVSDADALALRDALGLELPPWALGMLRRRATDAGGRLSWPPARRASLVNWLARLERGGDGRVPPDGLLDRALTFWAGRYARERERLAAEHNELHPVRGSRADQRLRLRAALVELWRDPDRAARELYRLYRGALRAAVRDALRDLATEDERERRRAAGDGTTIFLPWRLRERPPDVQQMLRAMGLAASVAGPPPTRLRPPGRLGLALGLCAGVALAGLGAAAAAFLAPRPPVLEPADPAFADPVFAAQTIQRVAEAGDGSHVVAAGTPRWVVTGTAPRGSRVEVTWRWATPSAAGRPRDFIVLSEASLPMDFGGLCPGPDCPDPNMPGADAWRWATPPLNPEPIPESESELWRAGTLPQPIRGCAPGWPRRSLVAIEADRDDPAAARLAAALLDRGSADVVLVGRDALVHLDRLVGMDAALAAEDQLVVVRAGSGAVPPAPAFAGRYAAVAAEDLGALVGALDFAGIRPVDEAWGDVATQLAGDGSAVEIRGGPAVWPDPETGIEFVEVCGGTFTMGDDGSEYEDERPAHPVTLSPFWIARTETTGAQYRKQVPGHEGPDDEPAAYVSWNEAHDFCSSFDHALPTEAQWESAARGGTTTQYSFGDDAGALDTYAWSRDNSELRAHEVATRAPNPLGLHDVHGNLWEWVEDCWDAEVYDRRAAAPPAVDPAEVGCGPGAFRVLRGGSFRNGPRFLRSADRDRVGPELEGDDGGFRCVRGPRRQP